MPEETDNDKSNGLPSIEEEIQQIFGGPDSKPPVKKRDYTREPLTGIKERKNMDMRALMDDKEFVKPTSPAVRKKSDEEEDEEDTEEEDDDFDAILACEAGIYVDSPSARSDDTIVDLSDQAIDLSVHSGDAKHEKDQDIAPNSEPKATTSNVVKSAAENSNDNLNVSGEDSTGNSKVKCELKKVSAGQKHPDTPRPKTVPEIVKAARRKYSEAISSVSTVTSPQPTGTQPERTEEHASSLERYLTAEHKQENLPQVFPDKTTEMSADKTTKAEMMEKEKLTDSTVKKRLQSRETSKIPIKVAFHNPLKNAVAGVSQPLPPKDITVPQKIPAVSSLISKMLDVDFSPVKEASVNTPQRRRNRKSSFPQYCSPDNAHEPSQKKRKASVEEATASASAKEKVWIESPSKKPSSDVKAQLKQSPIYPIVKKKSLTESPSKKPCSDAKAQMKPSPIAKKKSPAKNTSSDVKAQKKQSPISRGRILGTGTWYSVGSQAFGFEMNEMVSSTVVAPHLEKEKHVDEEPVFEETFKREKPAPSQPFPKRALSFPKPTSTFPNPTSTFSNPSLKISNPTSTFQDECFAVGYPVSTAMESKDASEKGTPGRQRSSSESTPSRRKKKSAVDMSTNTLQAVPSHHELLQQMKAEEMGHAKDRPQDEESSVDAKDSVAVAVSKEVQDTHKPQDACNPFKRKVTTPRKNPQVKNTPRKGMSSKRKNVPADANQSEKECTVSKPDMVLSPTKRRRKSQIKKKDLIVCQSVSSVPSLDISIEDAEDAGNKKAKRRKKNVQEQRAVGSLNPVASTSSSTSTIIHIEEAVRMKEPEEPMILDEMAKSSASGVVCKRQSGTLIEKIVAVSPVFAPTPSTSKRRPGTSKRKLITSKRIGSRKRTIVKKVQVNEKQSQGKEATQRITRGRLARGGKKDRESVENPPELPTIRRSSKARRMKQMAVEIEIEKKDEHSVALEDQEKDGIEQTNEQDEVDTRELHRGDDIDVPKVMDEPLDKAAIQGSKSEKIIRQGCRKRIAALTQATKLNQQVIDDDKLDNSNVPDHQSITPESDVTFTPKQSDQNAKGKKKVHFQFPSPTLPLEPTTTEKINIDDMLSMIDREHTKPFKPCPKATMSATMLEALFGLEDGGSESKGGDETFTPLPNISSSKSVTKISKPATVSSPNSEELNTGETNIELVEKSSRSNPESGPPKKFYTSTDKETEENENCDEVRVYVPGTEIHPKQNEEESVVIAVYPRKAPIKQGSSFESSLIQTDDTVGKIIQKLPVKDTSMDVDQMKLNSQVASPLKKEDANADGRNSSESEELEYVLDHEHTSIMQLAETVAKNALDKNKLCSTQNTQQLVQQGQAVEDQQHFTNTTDQSDNENKCSVLTTPRVEATQLESLEDCQVKSGSLNNPMIEEIQVAGENNSVITLKSSQEIEEKLQKKIVEDDKTAVSTLKPSQDKENMKIEDKSHGMVEDLDGDDNEASARSCLIQGFGSIRELAEQFIPQEFQDNEQDQTDPCMIHDLADLIEENVLADLIEENCCVYWGMPGYLESFLRSPHASQQVQALALEIPKIPKTPNSAPVPRKRPATSSSSGLTSSVKKGKMLVKMGSPPRKRKEDKPSGSGEQQLDYLDYLKDFNKNDERSPSPLMDQFGAGSASPAIADSAPRKGSIIATPLKIGYLGLGIMGTGMVANLLRSGHEVTVWNRTPSKCKEFVKQGALKANSPAEVVQGCDITFSSVSDPSALKDLVFGNCGVLQGIGPGKAYVDMSTVDTETVADIHEAVTARGGRFLEAPVIGSKQPAGDGQLIILTSGDKSLYEDCYTSFQAMGKRTFYLGEIGCATKMKLTTNLLVGSVLAGLAEALALAEKIGLDHDQVMQIIDMSPVSCALIRQQGSAMINSKFNDPNSKLQNLQKDIRLAVNLSDTVDQPLHVGGAVNELFKKAKAKGYGEHDTAALYRAAAL